jgi:pimeloyl-ACP methyl ester carboxylesterase/DNA-binding CsgD family transcriptional regulator
VNQTIRFTRSPDGTRIAYAESGSGPPIVKAANWLSHLEFDWQSPVWRHWFSFLSNRNRLIRYDQRGCGLSDWECADMSLEAHVADLEAVVNASGVDRFALFGISQGGPIATEYVLRHPERITRLVLYGAYARGWKHRDAVVQSQALHDLVRVGWGQDNPAYRRLFANLFVPDASEEQVQWFADLTRITSAPEIAARLLECLGEVNLVEKLGEVRVPTLVMHAHGDARLALTEGRILAAGIPGARFVTLESRNHILLEHEPAWGRFCDVFGEFVEHAPETRAVGANVPPAVSSKAAARLSELTDRERAILTHLAQGMSNAEIAEKVFISEKTVRNHLTNIFDKLDVDSRAKAIVLAHQGGLGL